MHVPRCIKRHEYKAKSCTFAVFTTLNVRQETSSARRPRSSPASPSASSHGGAGAEGVGPPGRPSSKACQRKHEPQCQHSAGSRLRTPVRQNGSQLCQQRCCLSAGRPRGSLPNSKLALKHEPSQLESTFLSWLDLSIQPGRHTERRSASPANLSEISSCLKKSETSSCRQLLTCPALPIRVAALWRSHPGIGASRRAQGRRPFSAVCFSMSVTKARPNSSPATCFLCKMPAEEAPSRCHVDSASQSSDPPRFLAQVGS